ncbi:MAG TPA: GNAT family N-acetyltransferase [Pyrinomonadaceae bacterium]|nr:GNAT family N-acetyltransferase [Pyrinomonadaceae bacterium]
MNITLRRAQIYDADILLELMREFYAVEHLTFVEETARAAVRQLLANPEYGAVFLARGGEEEQFAGYVVVTFGFSLEFHGRNALVDELYVRENFRGRGVGGECLRHVEGFCRREGVRFLHLEVDRANTRAQALYRRAGFRDHDRYLLTKTLAG